MADVALADGAQDRVADGMHQNIRVGMAVQTLGVRNFHAAQNEFTARHERMDNITDADVIHGAEYRLAWLSDQVICRFWRARRRVASQFLNTWSDRFH